MAHHDPELWRRHKARKARQGSDRQPQGRESAASRQQRQRLRAMRDRMRGNEDLEFRV